MFNFKNQNREYYIQNNLKEAWTFLNDKSIELNNNKKQVKLLVVQYEKELKNFLRKRNLHNHKIYLIFKTFKNCIEKKNNIEFQLENLSIIVQKNVKKFA